MSIDSRTQAHGPRWLISFALATVLALLAGCATAPQGGEATAEAKPTSPETTVLERRGPRLTTRNQALLPDGSLSPIEQGRTSRFSVVALDAPDDLWERIRMGFGMPDLENELVDDQEKWYATRPDYIHRMTERSRKYLFHIVEELERRDMPTELALLPFIESAFNPQAVSSAKAAGMVKSW